VCAGEGVEDDEVEEALERLVDRSLVYVERTDGPTRFRMLQTLHDYAADRLATRGDENEVLRAHADWVRGLASAVQFGARTSGATISAVQDEDVAVRDAVGWSIGADPALALEICTMLGPFWFGTMRASTGWDLLAAALDAAGDDDPTLRASALVWAVIFATMVHDLETAARLDEEASAFELALGDPERLGRLGFARALAAGYRGDGDSVALVEEARRNLEAAGTETGLGHLLFADGATRLVRGDLENARRLLGEAAAAFRRQQDHLGCVLAVSRLGELAWRLGDLDQFADLHAELLALGRDGRSPGVITGATARLALAHLERGDVDRAQALAQEALASTGESFMAVINGYAFKSAGLVNLALGHLDEGRDQLRSAIDAFERGTGALGTGLAALCWVDLGRSYLGSGDADAADRASASAVERARLAGDPWVLGQAEAHRAEVVPTG
jgi:tetratricopeptide (TPR) repeat protein